MTNRFSKWKYILGLCSILALIYFIRPSSESVKIYMPNEYIDFEAPHSFNIESTNLMSKDSDADNTSKSRLNKYDIAYALDSVFRERDLDLVRDTCLVFGDLAFPVSAYNPATGVGYVWLGFDRLGEGLMDGKLQNTKSQKKCENEFLASLDEGLELFFDDEAKFLDDVFGKEKLTKEEKEDEVAINHWELTLDSLRSSLVNFEDVRHRFEAFNRSREKIESTVLDEWDFFGKTLNEKSETVVNYGKEIRLQLKDLNSYSDKKEYLELVIQDMRKQLEVEYIASQKKKSILDDWKLSAAEVIEEPDRFFGVLSRMDQIRMHWPSKELIAALNSQILQISLYKDSKSWWKHSNALIALFNENKTPGLCNKRSYHKLLADIMNGSAYPKWKKRYNEIEMLGGKENLSLQELKSLNGIAYKSGIYIAPISVLDDRLIYDMEEEKHLAKLDSLRTRIAESKLKKERKGIQEELMELSSDRATNYNVIRNKAKQKSITILQDDFRDFMDWADKESAHRSKNGA